MFSIKNNLLLIMTLALGLSEQFINKKINHFSNDGPYTCHVWSF